MIWHLETNPGEIGFEFVDFRWQRKGGGGGGGEEWGIQDLFMTSLAPVFTSWLRALTFPLTAMIVYK